MRRQQGVISVFMLFVITVFMFFACVLVDLMRINIFNSSAKKMVEGSFTSELAEYVSELKSQYGLYAIYNEEYVKRDFEKILIKNINEKQKEGFFRLYNIRLENISIEPIYSLGSNDIIEGQMYRYMKYRGPVSIVNFIAKLGEMNKYKESSKLSKQKLTLDKKVAELANKYEQINTNIRDFKKKGEEVIQNIDKYCSIVMKIEDEEDADALASLNNKKKKTYEDIKNDLDAMIALCNNIKNTASKIDSITQKLDEYLTEIKNTIAIGENEMVAEYVAKVKADIKQIEASLENVSIKDISKKCDSNLAALEKAKISIKNIYSEKQAQVEKDKLIKAYFDEIIGNNDDIDDNLKACDEREKIANDVDGNIKKKETKDKEIPEEKLNGLYSRTNSNNELGKLSFDEDEEKTICDNAFDFFSNMAFDVTEELIKTIYINEYVMNIFDNRLNYQERLGKKDKLFDYEIEYIINGCRKQSDNALQTNLKIFMIRFVLNSMHVYTSESKSKFALAIATSVGGAIGGGIAIPAIQNMIMCGWAGLESNHDLNELLKGNDIPLFKTEQNWATNIKGLKNNKEENNQGFNIYTSYHDYMRFLLLTIDDATKLNRMKDLIQLNIQELSSSFSLDKCTVLYKINAELSVNYLFMTQAFIPEEYKKSGRHLCKVETYMGY